MVYTSISLDNLSIADLSTIQIKHHVDKRSYGRRFTLYQAGASTVTKKVIFHQLYKKAKKLSKEAIKNQNLTEIELVKSFTAKLLAAETKAIKDYKKQSCIYKIRTAFHRFFGATPWFSTHLKRITALDKKIENNITKYKDLLPDTLPDEWLACLENNPNPGKSIDILNTSQTFQTHIRSMIPGENEIVNLIQHDPGILKEIEIHTKNTHTLIDTSVNKLFSDFLKHKLTYGSLKEKLIYQNMAVEAFVERLLTKRPLSFDSRGSALLRNRKLISDYFDEIKNGNLDLDDYLSPDEIQLSGFLITATPTHFINKGDFYNLCYRLNPAHHQYQGIYYGISSACLTKQNYMEEELVCLRPDRLPNLYYPFLTFFGGFTPFIIAEFECNKSSVESNYYLISENCYLDKAAYKKIMEVRISAFLKDANNQAKALGKMAYLHVIPLLNKLYPFTPNLPIHLILSAIQQEIYQELLESHQFTHIDTLHFSSFPDLKKFESFGSVKVNSSFRNPADKLDDDNLLLCIQYESNPNSFPGNWYWNMNIGSDGTPPVLCSTIAELQNPLINENVSNLYIYK